MYNVDFIFKVTFTLPKLSSSIIMLMLFLGDLHLAKAVFLLQRLVGIFYFDYYNI
jgi:hypothetical protein